MKVGRWLLASSIVVAMSMAVSSTPAHAVSDSTSRWGTFGLLSRANAESPTPVPIGNLTDITVIAAGNSSDMALDGSGDVWTWGDSTDGELAQGREPTPEPSSAVKVKGLPPIASIAEADTTDVAVDTTGHVWGWGWNESGQLCTGSNVLHKEPIELKNISGVAAVAGAGPHLLYLMDDGSLEACGANLQGELGDGTFQDSATPVRVTGLPSSPIVAITAGELTSTVLLQNGQVWDWGYNKWGQLGDGTTSNSDVPVQVDLPTRARQVYTGGDAVKNGQSLALLTDGTIWGWGNDKWGQLGNDTTSPAEPIPVRATALPAGVKFTFVASGGSHSLALASNGDVYGWGNNNEGQVGVGGAAMDVLDPQVVMSGADMVSATADDSVAHSSS
jgi:alpha-tubulin suppressor-like RCC1 family protein